MLLRPFCSNLLNSFLIMSVCKYKYIKEFLNSFLIMSVCKYKYIKEFLNLFYVYCARTVEFQVFFFFFKDIL